MDPMRKINKKVSKINHKRCKVNFKINSRTAGFVSLYIIGFRTKQL